MNKIYGWIDSIWQMIAETVFVRFEFDLPKGDSLRPLVEKDRLIFTLTSGGWIEWLILSSWCRSQGLGAILVSNRKRILLLAKPKYFFQVLFRRKTYGELILSEQDGPRLLFCPSHERKKLFDPTPVEKLLAELYSGSEPVGGPSHLHFIPVFILWRKHLRGTGRTLSEYFFGLSSNPNFFGKIWYLLRARLDSTVRSLGVVNMPSKAAEEGEEELGETEAMRVAKSTRRRILVLTQQEMRVVLGPRYHSPLAVKETLLKDPELLQVIQQTADEEGLDRKKVMSRAYGYLTEIVANQKFRFIEVMYVILTWSFAKVFDGLSAEESEFQKVREIMKTKPVVFVPCHRSHFDYLVIPYVMFLNDMVPPHVAAGVNLSFWPAGHFLRLGGAFFIRRSFRGDKLYTACLRKYIEYLLKNRFNMKFFIEGTRSRSGKMLAPAYGILKMVMETQKNHVLDDIALIPVSLCYDEVPEQGAYTKELGGGQKEKESAKGLIKSREIMKRNFGKVYVRLSDAIFTKDVFAAAETAGTDQTLMLQKTAFQICKSINDVTPITPKSLVCSVLLGSRMSSVSLEEILRLSVMLGEYVKWRRLPLSAELDDPFKRSVEQTVRRLVKSGAISVSESVPRAYYCENRKRIHLNFYKNNAIHCLVIPAITLLAFFDTLRAVGRGSTAEFRARFLDSSLALRNILKFEFFFSPTPSFVEEVDATMGYFDGGDGWAEKPVGQLIDSMERRFEKWDDVALFMNLLGELLESYYVSLRFLKESQEKIVEKKALLQRMVKYAEGLLDQGGIAFPESMSTQNFSNALQLFDNLKFLTLKREGEKTTFEIQGWSERMENLEHQLGGFLSLMRESPASLVRHESRLTFTEAASSSPTSL